MSNFGRASNIFRPNGAPSCTEPVGPMPEHQCKISSVAPRNSPPFPVNAPDAGPIRPDTSAGDATTVVNVDGVDYTIPLSLLAVAARRTGVNPKGTHRNPIKHWRKQLLPRDGYTGGRGAVALDVPGNTVRTSSGPECILPYLSDTVQANATVTFGSTGSKSSCAGTAEYQSCIGACGPEANVIKSAQVRTTPGYCTTTKELLRRRGSTYDQCMTFKGETVTGDANQCSYTQPDPWRVITSSVSCLPGCGDTVHRVYKPNNTKFATQGAVSSGTAIMRKKLDAQAWNAASYCKAKEPSLAATEYRGVFNPSGFLNKPGVLDQCRSSLPPILRSQC